ncbi:MarR family transcriptional regulator [Halorubellus sp. JP-L1]|uniref:helix-turn-helix transcriptional regulator n=1 Tax=Halorubellus sp. JP-L1 TaxID=2715753 RepID=UPI0014072F36|nr:helix-turn-helix domain-containing protein [Halorubellus sp. JP-L1]NHN40439.1 MarR family transcriptional regulator [Halorubellus sp. JP-L1]
MTTDALSFLADSRVRPRLLAALREYEAARPSDLRDELGVSRATVHRNLSALCERGWVHQGDDGYAVTTAGVLVHETFDAFRSGMQTVETFEGLLEAIPADGVPPLPVLATADVVTATRDKPHAPVMRYVEELTASDTTTVQGLTPVRSEMFDHGHEELLDAGVETELLLPVDVLERQRDEGGEELQTAIARDGFSVYALEADPGFGLTVTEDRAFVGGYGPDNQLVALAVSTDDSFVSWAADTFESLRSNANRVSGRGAEVESSVRPD